jgi:hypothetical protein
MFMAWNDEKEERWLSEQERSGWHLKVVRCFGYTLERATPADVAYRLDVGPSARHDREEYFGLFRDAGWEHVGTRGLWHIFRKPVVNGQVPEIYTDPESRLAKYRRLMALMGVFLAVLATQTAPRVAGNGQSAIARYPAILIVQVLAMAVFVYGITRLALVIRKLKRSQGKQT